MQISRHLPILTFKSYTLITMTCRPKFPTLKHWNNFINPFFLFLYETYRGFIGTAIEQQLMLIFYSFFYSKVLCYLANKQKNIPGHTYSFFFTSIIALIASFLCFRAKYFSKSNKIVNYVKELLNTQRWMDM